MTAEELAARAGGPAECAGVEVEHVDPDRGREEQGPEPVPPVPYCICYASFSCNICRTGNFMEGGMGNVPAAQVEERIRSAFPEGAIERVQVLAHGDDPEVAPGQ